MIHNKQWSSTHQISSSYHTHSSFLSATTTSGEDAPPKWSELESTPTDSSFWSSEIKTPFFLVDLQVLDRNCRTMIQKANECGISLRPHVKTHKTLEGAKHQTIGLKDPKLVVSTLAEAEYYSAHYKDIHYAVPALTKAKMKQIESLTRRIPKFHIDVESESSLKIIEDYAKTHNIQFSVFVQVDCGQHRVGVDPSDEASLRLVQKIYESPNVKLAGIYTHAGQSYSCRGKEEIRRVVMQEAQIISDFAQKLHRMGIHPNTVAVGSTPTCAVGTREEWSNTLVNEIHPGNYVFYDYMQTRIGSCDIKDCSAFVVASVIGHRPSMNQLTIDAGALALSKDIGCSNVSCASYGYIKEDETLQITNLTQEIGIVTSEKPINFEAFRIGTKLTIIPNHSCLSAALFDKYYVINNSKEAKLIDIWSNIRGW
ncbi:hypothetical protein C9374_008451 [Naegleria lovaniensis]|uniref:D-serine dehydratase n=1 Tax=Naegleria lovaniensis TaxID=51637 RepID=A0AA88GLE3_NAELO|nr:uncharacterized protein C9374_008451 [Naegleria lovaniensis]KAG2378308.1 hypothetical protein C9374_008451 [Naegleria lovaniensis]